MTKVDTIRWRILELLYDPKLSWLQKQNLIYSNEIAGVVPELALPSSLPRIMNEEYNVKEWIKCFEKQYHYLLECEKNKNLFKIYE